MGALWLCVDCTQYAHGLSAHERGEEYPQATLDAFSDPVRSLGDITPGLTEHACEDSDGFRDDDCECEEITFSWSRCDGCLSPLGGSRSAFTLFD